MREGRCWHHRGNDEGKHSEQRERSVLLSVRGSCRPHTGGARFAQPARAMGLPAVWQMGAIGVARVGCGSRERTRWRIFGHVHPARCRTEPRRRDSALRRDYSSAVASVGSSTLSNARFSVVWRPRLSFNTEGVVLRNLLTPLRRRFAAGSVRSHGVHTCAALPLHVGSLPVGHNLPRRTRFGPGAHGLVASTLGACIRGMTVTSTTRS